MMNDIVKKLDIIIPEPKCELNYRKDYEMLIATVLSAQCTDKRVNLVTKEFFLNYDLNKINNTSQEEIKNIINSLGSASKKSLYIKEIAKRLLKEKNGVVPNDREYLESLPGVGRKTSNVVLSELFNVPTMAVDTHVERVSKRLGFALETDNVIDIEKKLLEIFDGYDINRINHQLLLFGRYVCLAKKPKCDNCLLKDYCKLKQ